MSARNGQASMEFIILLGAVAAFAVSVLAIYLHVQHLQTSNYVELLNAAANQTRNYSVAVGNASSQPLEYIYLPAVAYLNQSSQLQVVLYSGTAATASLSISAQGLEYVPAGYYNVSIGQVRVFSFSVIPERTGKINLTVSTEVNAQPASYINRSVSFYSVLPAAAAGNESPPSPPLFVPRINETHGAVLSNLVQGGNVTYLSQWSHCGYIGFWGHELSMQAECGSDAKWYYYIFSPYCYYDDAVAWATTCIYENQMNSGIYSPGTQDAYAYNVSLALSNASSGITLHSQFGNPGNASALSAMPGNYAAGNVLISNSITAYVPVQDYAYSLLRKSGNYTIINSSETAQYLQLFNDINNVLGYYNGSEIDGGELATIQQTISSYNKVAAEVYNSTPAASPCGVTNYQNSTWYSCRPFGEIEFGNITVEISNSLPHRSGSFNLAGSYIYVR